MQTASDRRMEKVCSMSTTTSNYLGIVEGRSSEAAVNSLIFVAAVGGAWGTRCQSRALNELDPRSEAFGH